MAPFLPDASTVTFLKISVLELLVPLPSKPYLSFVDFTISLPGPMTVTPTLLLYTPPSVPPVTVVVPLATTIEPFLLKRMTDDDEALRVLVPTHLMIKPSRSLWMARLSVPVRVMVTLVSVNVLSLGVNTAVPLVMLLPVMLLQLSLVTLTPPT